MDRSFYANRPFIENEFEYAKFDTSTGIDPAILYESLKEMSDAPTDEPRPIVHARLFSYLWITHNCRSMKKHPFPSN
jgi:hypothetical protein